ncbi:MAG: hypothetical protein H6712_15140 [Myxococcales bacterium]|nr:hypothetical protein [Myxococcales bacterium]MCB9715200.1 hypothetical protein [Myxococcales bacterium]
MPIPELAPSRLRAAGPLGLVLLLACGRTDMALVPSTGGDSSSSGESSSEDSGTTGGSTEGETDLPPTTISTSDTTFGDTTFGDTTFGDTTFGDTTFGDTTFGDTTFGDTTDEPIACGNGILEPGEECDPGEEEIGPDRACVPGCMLNVCGDAMPGPDEECDDGNMDEQDACLPGCQLASCGDGILWLGVEECDDGDGDDDDACHLDCTHAEAVAVTAGGNHGCALIDQGALRCWGNGNNGRTGHGSLDNVGDDEPVSAVAVVSLGGPVLQVVAGISHTCVRYSGGDVRCFGRSAEGQLGYGVPGDVGDDELPVASPLVPLGGPVDLLATGSGSFHGCARLSGGGVRCWGDAGAGRLGVPGITGFVGDDEPAGSIPLVDVGGAVEAMSTGAQHTCALLSGGTVRCWGSNTSGQLGLGLPGIVGDDESPAAVSPVPLGGAALEVVAGWYHSCARLDDGTVRCWGRGNNGRLGYGNTQWIGLTDTPADHGVVDVGGVVVSLTAGNAHTCARLDTGAVRCWGWGAQGQLGYGNLQDIGDDEVPAAAGDVPLGEAALQISAGSNHTCALLVSGQVRCWGNGGDGRLGYGNLDTIGDDETPASAGDVPLIPP